MISPIVSVVYHTRLRLQTMWDRRQKKRTCLADAAILSPTLRKTGGTPWTKTVLSRGRCCTASDSLITCMPTQHSASFCSHDCFPSCSTAQRQAVLLCNEQDSCNTSCALLCLSDFLCQGLLLLAQGCSLAGSHEFWLPHSSQSGWPCVAHVAVDKIADAL